MKMKGNVIVFLLLLSVVAAGASALFSTSPEAYLQQRMGLMDKLYERFFTTHYQDSKVKQQLLTELPDLIQKLKSHPSSVFSGKAARYENMLHTIQNWGQSTGGGTQTNVPGTGSNPNISTNTQTLLAPMKIKLFIRELGKVDLIPGSYAAMNSGPYQFCPTGTAYFPVHNPGDYEFRAKAIAHADVIKRFKIDKLIPYQELFIDLFPAPTLMVEVRGASGQLFKGANITISLFKDGRLVKSVPGPYHLFSELDAGCTYHALVNALGLPPKKSRSTSWPGSPFAWHDTLVIQY